MGGEGSCQAAVGGAQRVVQSAEIGSAAQAVLVDMEGIHFTACGRAGQPHKDQDPGKHLWKFNILEIGP